MINLTDQSFADEVNASDLMLVDFWAEWCSPCKKMLPILEEIDSEGKLLVGKLNVDENPAKMEEYSVHSIPTMVLFKSGQPVKTIIGAMPKHKLMKEIEEWI